MSLAAMSESGKNHVVVGLGEVLWDVYREGRFLGGTPANFAVHIAQLGDHGVLVSRVGDDSMGRELLAELRQRRVSGEYVQVDRLHGTGTVRVTVDIQGIPSYSCSKDVALDYVERVPAHQPLALSADAVLFTTLGQRSSAARHTIQHFLRTATQAVKILDVNVPLGKSDQRQVLTESLNLATILKVNRAGLDSLRLALRPREAETKRFIDALFKKFSLRVIAVTLGENGCELYDPDHHIKVDGLPVRVLDANGAGDAFTAGLVHQFLRGAPLREMAEYANLLGAFVCTSTGATPLFSPATIEGFRDSLS